ncbi:hypothetical protein F2P56_010099 [Juglans regia]|uniref:Uncharacterized protein n=1 Tax=Juglans regia TaxID=51240 RepID=A0A833XY82_JUGRE|nr:hypothetical protein F2P56_010099 [Juglans regia]
MSLVKWGKRHRTKPLIFEIGPGFDAIVVYADLFVGVSNVDVEGKVVVERVIVGGEVELGKRGVGDMKLDPVGADDEPEDEDRKAYNDSDAYNELEKQTEKAPTAAATTAASVAVIVSIRRWNCRAVVCSVQVRLFLCHGNQEN